VDVWALGCIFDSLSTLLVKVKYPVGDDHDERIMGKGIYPPELPVNAYYNFFKEDY